MVNNNMDDIPQREPDPVMPADEPFEGLLGYHIRRLSVIVMADLAASLAPIGLKPAEASVMFAIAAQAGPTQSDIGRMLGIQRANMAPLIAGLARRELIEREAIDGRSQLLRLSAAGRALQQEAWRRVIDHEDRMFATLPADSRVRLLGTLCDLWQPHDGGLA